MSLLGGLLSMAGGWFIVILLSCLFAVFLVVRFLRQEVKVNPFCLEPHRVKKPRIDDRDARDAILKQAFVRQRIPEELDVIIIGSGIGGLCAAALLAKGGKKVLVLEQHDQAGGCCHTYVSKGFEFDVGIHYVGGMQQQAFSKTLLDQISESQIEWAQLDSNFDTVVVGPYNKAKRVHLMSGRKEFRDSLLEAFPDEQEAIDKFLSCMKKARNLFNYYTVLKLLPSFLSSLLIHTGLLNLLTGYTSFIRVTTQQLLDSITSNQELKAVLAYSYGDYGVSPEESSCMMHALLINHYMCGAFYPVGGASEIALNIIPVIEKHGGRVLVRAKVSEILCEAGRAVGVRLLKGEEDITIYAKAIVSDAGLLNTLNMIPRDIADKSTVHSLIKDGQLRNGIAAMSLFVGLRGTTEELGLKAQNVWYHTDIDLNRAFRDYLDTKPDANYPGDIPLLFVSFPSAKDPTWTERYPGKSVCTVVSFARWEWFSEWRTKKVKKRGDDYEGFKKALGHQMWNQVLLDYPHLEDKVELFKVGSPITNDHYIGTNKGDIYGLHHNSCRFEPEVTYKLRPDIGIPGLFITGQDVLTCGFTGALFGGLLCASAVLSRNLFIDCIQLHKKLKNQIKQEKKKTK